MSTAATTSTLEQLQAELASLPAHGDIPTQRERERVWYRRQNLMSRIGIVQHNESVLAKYEPEFVTLTKWVADLTRLREVIAAQLLQIAATPDKSKTAADRTKSVELEYSLKKIDRGIDTYEVRPVTLTIEELLVAAGYEPGTWHGSLPYCTGRLAELTKQRAAAVKSREQALREYAAAN